MAASLGIGPGTGRVFTSFLPASHRVGTGLDDPPSIVRPDAPLQAAQILVVDDDPLNLRLLKLILEGEGYGRVETVSDSSTVVGQVAESVPDLILLDVHMPAPDGIELLGRLRPWIAPPAMVPVIMLTGATNAAIRRLALDRGARDFVGKPIDSGDLLLRIRNVLETRRLQLQIQHQNAQLERDVRARSDDLLEAQLELVERLALAAEYRDDDTQEHAQRVGRTAALLADRLGLGDEFAARLRRAAPLHDVGKIGIADAVFLKPGRFTPAEAQAMRQHVPIGVNILSGSASPVLQLAEEIARSHHERWDGTGYPGGLTGRDIPISGRIVAVADVFDAVVHERPYKPAWPIDAAVEEIARCGGSHFDPEIASAFMDLDHPYLLSPVHEAFSVADEARLRTAMAG